jgi:hypothetical protein
MCRKKPIFKYYRRTADVGKPIWVSNCHTRLEHRVQYAVSYLAASERGAALAAARITPAKNSVSAK